MAKTSNQPKHTPGPWKWVGTQAKPSIFAYLASPEEYVGAALDGFTENPANARLIETAPELLDALKAVHSLWSKHSGVPPIDSVICLDLQIQEIIRKVEGKLPPGQVHA